MPLSDSAWLLAFILFGPLLILGFRAYAAYRAGNLKDARALLLTWTWFFLIFFAVAEVSRYAFHHRFF